MDGRETPAGCRGFENTLKRHSALDLFEHDLFGKLVPTFPDHALIWAISGVTAPKRRTGQMARITLRQLLDHAAEHDYGVPAFNINNMEQALAIMEAASTLDAPVIIQASRGARSYANDIMLRHMMDAVTEIYPQIPVCVHLDHGNGPDTCM